ncbi:MAG: TonB family protein [Rhodothermia bacterium]|nr:TonB family protein [Rhodothermia bacterium]
MRIGACVLLIAVVSGCSSGSFVGKRFDNFTAYYNTFYNAQKSFDAATKALDSGDERVDRFKYLRVVDLPAGGAAGRDFENAIKKSADVLRDHPDSKWVDDALLLIGKSYYYTSNTVGAEQKFREVIQRESDLEDEARFWLGLTLMSSGALNEAGAHLRESIGEEDLERKWRARMHAVLGELYVRQERWQDAAEALEQSAGEMDDNQLGSRAQFLLGQVYETLGDYEAAAAAFRDVRRFNPFYELSYASRYNAIRVEGIYGDTDSALNDLRKMERDDKHFQYRAEIRYLRALILQKAGSVADAVADYTRLLYDADANVSTVRGPIHYQLGVIYRDILSDFTRAAAHFDTASTAIRAAQPSRAGSSQIGVLGDAPGAITDAREQAEIFGGYATIQDDVARLDSLLHLGSLDEEAFRARIQEIRRQRAAELVAERERQKSMAVQEQFGRSTGFDDPGRASAAAANTPTGSAGFLFHRDRTRVQENLLSFFDRWGERPLVVNWRRSAAVSGAAERDPVATEVAGQAPTDVVLPEGGSVTEDALLASVEVDLSAIPRTAEAIATMQAERATARYELANVLFLSIEMPDSAAAWYRTVVEENPDLPVASRALYAIAEVQRSLGDVESANAIYRRVLDEYPDSEVAGRAAERIGAKIEETVPRDLIDPESEYEFAYGAWKDGQYDQAAADMLAVASRFQGEEIAARALLATGAIVVDWSDQAGVDVLAPIALDVADSLWVAAGVVEPISADDSTAIGSTAAAGNTPRLPAGSSLVLADSNRVELADSTHVKAADDSGTIPPTIRDQDPDSTSRADADARLPQLEEDDPAAQEPARQDGSEVPIGLERQAEARAVDTGGDAPQDSSFSATPDPSVVDNRTAVSADRTAPSDALESRDTTLGDAVEVHKGAPMRDPVYLVDIYSVIEREYPETEYARVASGLRQALVDRRREREAAAAAAAAGDSSLAADSETVADSLATADSLMATGRPNGVVAEPAEFQIPSRLDAADSSAVDGAVSRRASEEFAAADSSGGDLRERRTERELLNRPDEVRKEMPQLETDAVSSAPATASDASRAATVQEVDTKPVMVGGPGALQRMVRYPGEAKEAGVSGNVVVSFVVDERGRVSDVQIVTGLGSGCDEEAMRVARLVRYRPAMKDGRPVRYRMQEEIAFGSPTAQP